jgi:hypothetical protein
MRERSGSVMERSPDFAGGFRVDEAGDDVDVVSRSERQAPATTVHKEIIAARAVKVPALIIPDKSSTTEDTDPTEGTEIEY